jgi:hypothetical protein
MGSLTRGAATLLQQQPLYYSQRRRRSTIHGAVTFCMLALILNFKVYTDAALMRNNAQHESCRETWCKGAYQGFRHSGMTGETMAVCTCAGNGVAMQVPS